MDGSLVVEQAGTYTELVRFVTAEYQAFVQLTCKQDMYRYSSTKAGYMTREMNGDKAE